MKKTTFCVLVFFLGLSLVGCGAGGVPEPIRVLENPETGERVRFFREISFKVPTNYSETDHIAEWRDAQLQAGYTKEIAPADDRSELAAIRKKNLGKNYR